MATRSLKVRRRTLMIGQVFELRYHPFHQSEFWGLLCWQLLWLDYQTPCCDCTFKIKSVYQAVLLQYQPRMSRSSNLTMHLSNRTFLKVPYEPMSATPEQEPENHGSLAQSSPSCHTSPSSTGYAADALASSSPFDSQSQHSSFPPPATQVQNKAALPTAELLEGILTSSHPKASDYVNIVNATLVWTMFDYEGLVSTHDAFPSPALCRHWALRCWKRVSKDVDEFYELSDRMCNLVSSFSVHPVAH